MEYFLEYSTHQKAFHIDTLERIEESNLKLIKKNQCNGYVIIAGPGSYEKMGEIAKKLRDEIQEV